MSFNFTILGVLKWKPMTGYDLKKIIQKTTFMYWSGNNNQIYKGLLALQNQGLVTNEVKHQDGAPSKKIYTITASGIEEFNKWIMESPKEPPEFKKEFLIQMALSGDLKVDNVMAILSQYEESVSMKLLMEKEMQRRQGLDKRRNKQEEYLWSMISENIINTYENELLWIEKVKAGMEVKGRK
ncbi:MAG: PadR family transcriptional regulator [Firmicutes bacterium]|nr:PadR family transcriptional regulator [Bacillota bacterium]